MDLCKILEAGVETIREEISRRNISLRTRCCEDPLRVEADPGEMEIVLNNLLGNAVKYNRDKGKIDIDTGIENGVLRLSVSDTGIGMTREEMAGLFKEFSRIRNEKTRGIQGSGLGLAIVKKIVDLYGGSIEVQSEPDAGTTFTVRIPIISCEKECADAEKQEILMYLREEDPALIESLHLRAEDTRRLHVGEDIHLRALIEISNHCTNTCHYCGLRAPNTKLVRYRMEEREILDCVDSAVELGLRTIVIQAGNDPRLTRKSIANLIKRILGRHDVAIALSLGERSYYDYAAWREAGAQRYLLRFETSDEKLFASMHGLKQVLLHPRLLRLSWLRKLGYEIGGGIMVGLPGQTLEILANDILFFQRYDLDMIGIGPFIPHPKTPLAGWVADENDVEQVSPTLAMTLKVIALSRLACPEANIPATTAIAAAAGEELRLESLRWGANVLMQNLTPEKYRLCYDIYPGKTAFPNYTSVQHQQILDTLEHMKRPAGTGCGERRRMRP